jgi:hypothetical protein
MSENKILEKLKRLYALAVLREEELGNEARENEARTAAFLLLKLSRENGVKIRFEVPKANPTTATVPSRRSVQTDFVSRPRYGVHNAEAFSSFMDDLLRQSGVRRREAGRNVVYEVVKEVMETPSPFIPPNRRTKKRKASVSEKYSPIIAKWQGICRVCGNPYMKGTDVYWVRGVGCAHEACGFERLIELDLAHDAQDELDSSPTK